MLNDGKLPTQEHQVRRLSFEQRINAVLLTLDSTGPLIMTYHCGSSTDLSFTGPKEANGASIDICNLLLQIVVSEVTMLVRPMPSQAANYVASCLGTRPEKHKCLRVTVYPSYARLGKRWRSTA